jgi:hypothetical protein
LITWRLALRKFLDERLDVAAYPSILSAQSLEVSLERLGVLDIRHPSSLCVDAIPERLDRMHAT